MKMKELIYSVGSHDTEIRINMPAREAAVVKNGTALELGFDEFFDIAELAATLKAQDRGPSVRPAQAPAPTPEPAPGLYEDREKPPTLTGNLEARDLTVSNMWVVRKDGKYFGRTTTGQVITPDKPINEARLFPSAEDAVAVASAIPGAEVKIFADVGDYRICLAFPDGQVKFWVGNGIDPSLHVNKSMAVSTRAAALMTMHTVAPLPGVKTFLLPDVS